jgi:hypothetical protein
MLPEVGPAGKEAEERAAQRPARSGVPRWGATLTLLVIGGIFLVVSDAFAVGPPAAMLVLVVVGIVLLRLSHFRGYSTLAHWIGRATLTLVSLGVAASAAFLAARLPATSTPGAEMLVDAALIWGANVLTFSLWYWEIDGGGPARRRLDYHVSSDFLFPQMTMHPDDEAGGGKGSTRTWAPLFVDYLFLAFNTSTAFSPTDTLVLSRRAKLLMMTQSMISLVVIAVLAARAINSL